MLAEFCSFVKYFIYVLIHIQVDIVSKTVLACLLSSTQQKKRKIFKCNSGELRGAGLFKQDLYAITVEDLGISTVLNSKSHT